MAATSASSVWCGSLKTSSIPIPYRAACLSCSHVFPGQRRCTGWNKSKPIQHTKSPLMCSSLCLSRPIGQRVAPRPNWPRLCGLRRQLSGVHSLFQEGELALVIDSRHRRLIRLDPSKYTDTRQGRLSHNDVIGREVGAESRTALGGRVTVRRPSLEEYSLLMHRGATPSYCSVAYTALCMLDVGGGSKVAEAGTGSGAMTLHLSRSVGAGGRVFSFEVKQTHLEIARQNFSRWSKSWDLAHTHNQWPDNVSFYCANLQEVQHHMAEPVVDGVFLDLPHSHCLLATVVDILRPCGVAVLFLPNITQAVAVDAFIRSNNLPLITEEIVRVNQEQWTVRPARTKRLVAPTNELSSTGDGESLDVECDNSGSTISGSREAATRPAYICRPNHHQLPHSGFLMKIRRILRRST